ncbi:MAG: single-stranded-DNA-specific exonuclease RecJ [Alphaproteobacteria bacterium]|nr:single-stranded-DNA-specific exonuclease RecJ [Alphaproteobacteria bacterium]
MSKRILSLTNRIWNIAEGGECFCCPSDVVCAILRNRGISEDVELFKKTTLKRTMPDPFVFIDMEKAVNRFVKAINEGEKIAILGDYDVDGVSSTVLLMSFLRYLKVPYSYSIPNRMEDGYGLSIDNLRKYKDHLVVTVDCGSSSFDELSYALSENMDVIVIDHHKMTAIPDTFAVVNPHRPDESEKYRNLCAAGMVFMFIVGINRKLREEGFYRSHALKEPDLFDYLDLVALATVCDVMPLIDLNRAFVIAGIKTMYRRKNLGIDALINLNKISEISSDTIAFSFGPKINAAGRLASADVSVKLLMTQNPVEAKQLAQRLDDLNKERQRLESEMIEEAVQGIDENLDFICVHSNNWHVGIVGIVAGRLKETYHKPSLVIAIDKDGKGRGSCRSVPGVDISLIINKGIEKGIISSGGGHTAAAGFCISADKIDALIEFLKEEIKYEKSQEELRADCYMPVKFISLDMMRELAEIGPFGNGNKHPKFVIPRVKIANAKVVGKNHVQLCLQDEQSGGLVRAIAFRSADTVLGEVISNCNEKNSVIQGLGSLTVSEWNGKKRISFILEDIADNDALNMDI